MATTASTALHSGSEAIDFALPNTNPRVTAASWSLTDSAEAKALLVAFVCNHCPYVIHIRQGLASFARDYLDQGLSVVAISANDISTHPADAPDKMAEVALSENFVFPYLYDESQETARAYGAVCTPDFFLFDADRRLVYRGQFDGSRPGNNVPVTGEDMRRAVDAVLAGRKLTDDPVPSIGCSIKWKPGNEPD